MDHAGPGFRLVRGVAGAASVASGGVLRRAEFERDAALGAGPLVVDPVFTGENIPNISSSQDGLHITFGHYLLSNIHGCTRLQATILHLKN